MTTIEHDARAERCAAAPVNIPEALLNMANDESLLAEVIHVFFRTIPDMLESVRRAVDETQLEALSVQAHGIKGAAANICAKPPGR